MAGDSLVVRQRTLWRMEARPAAPGVRRVRACPADRRRVTGRRIRIARSVRRPIVPLLRVAKKVLGEARLACDLYSQPHRAGGASLAGDVYAEGAAAGDPRILADAITRAVAELGVGAARLEEITEPTPTLALPGTAEKLEVMRQRFERFESLHSKRDARREG